MVVKTVNPDSDYCPMRFLRCRDDCEIFDKDEQACSIKVQAANSKRIVLLIEAIAEIEPFQLTFEGVKPAVKSQGEVKGYGQAEMINRLVAADDKEAEV